MNTNRTPNHKPPDPEIARKIRDLGPAPESTLVRTASYLRLHLGPGSTPKHSQKVG